MGQSARRRQKFFDDHPVCCFCGGETLAVEIDHVPSVQMFAGKQRPKGLESPACEDCNRETRNDEQVAAMFARSWPPPSTDLEKLEIREIMRSVHNNRPDLFRELVPDSQTDADLVRAGLNERDHSAFTTGDLTNRSIRRFAYKLACALYYAKTTSVVPTTGGVWVSWYTNYDHLMKGIPEDIFRLLGRPETLQQGKQEVGNQFNYAWALSDTRQMGQFFASFRHSFCIHCDATVFDRLSPTGPIFDRRLGELRRIEGV